MKSSDLKLELRKELKLKKINNDKDLISLNILDSLNIVTLVSFVEKKLKLKCNLYKIDNKNFSSINKMVMFLKKYNKTKIK
jgi:acyl carrier protein